jgi:hypothetical protein
MTLCTDGSIIETLESLGIKNKAYQAVTCIGSKESGQV